MEQTIEESDLYMSKKIGDQMLNNLLNETKSETSNNLLLEVGNKKVPDIKLELEIDDFQIELLPHFKENRSLAEHKHAQTKLKTSNSMATLEKSDLYKDFQIKNEEIIIQDEEMTLNKISMENGSVIKLEESEAIEGVDKMDEIVDVKRTIENEEVHITEEGNIKDKKHGNVLTLGSRQQLRRTHAASVSKKISGDNFKCKQCKYTTTKKNYLRSHLELHEKSMKMIRLYRKNPITE